MVIEAVVFLVGGFVCCRILPIFAPPLRRPSAPPPSRHVAPPPESQQKKNITWNDVDIAGSVTSSSLQQNENRLVMASLPRSLQQHENRLEMMSLPAGSLQQNENKLERDWFGGTVERWVETKPPVYSVGHLRVKYAHWKQYVVGTAFICKLPEFPKTPFILTAAHNLCQSRACGLEVPTEVSIGFPDGYSKDKDVPMALVTNVVHPDYQGFYKVGDLGLCRLKLGVGDLGLSRLNHFYKIEEQAQKLAKSGDDVTVLGYPQEKSSERAQFQHHGPLVKCADQGMLAYEADTGGGQSGGPVTNKDGLVIGVHVHGTNHCNYATRLTTDKIAWIKKHVQGWTIESRNT